MPNPQVSVIIPAYNRVATIGRSIASVRGQGITAEIVVVDDGSTDATARVVHELAGLSGDVVLLHQENLGPARARNAGVEVARAPLLVFLDSDDELMAGALERMTELAAAAGAALVFSAFTRPRPSGDVINRPVPIDLSASVNVSANFIPGSFAITRSLFDEVGGYDPVLRFGENTDLVLRAIDRAVETGRAMVATDVPTVRYLQPARDEARYDEQRLAAVERLLALRRYGNDRAALAKAHSIAAVNASRTTAYGKSLHHAWAAVRLAPGDWRHAARLTVAATGPLGRRLWTNTRRRQRRMR